jgi:hypothetical protein
MHPDRNEFDKVTLTTVNKNIDDQTKRVRMLQKDEHMFQQNSKSKKCRKYILNNNLIFAKETTEARRNKRISEKSFYLLDFVQNII